MAAWSQWFAFTEANIKAYVPTRKGVYALIEKGELVYYGMSDADIEDRLLKHRRGYEVPATQNADQFCYVEVADPLATEKALLEEYKRTHSRLPRYNSKVG